jgi:hypothetical protein
MQIHWDRLPRLVLPLGLACLVALILSDFFNLSRYWSVPIALFVVVELQKRGYV